MRYVAGVFMAMAIFWGSACRHSPPAAEAPLVKDSTEAAPITPGGQPEPPAGLIAVPYDVRIRDFFSFLDSLIACTDSLLPYPLSEHLLVRANPWIIDTLAGTDYYRMMALDSFVFDQQLLLALRQGDTLILPGPIAADSLLRRMASTVIDINIPEFRLRIIEQGDTIYGFPIRVGRNQKRYLALAGTTVDLRTRPGEGRIIRISRYPLFLDPHTGRRFTHTRRDDGRTTLMPLIPWLEPEIDGQRYGQLIHPTTNPRTLGKAYSNGCIGLGEGDSWILYYYAPLGARVQIRYELQIENSRGDTIVLKDIYGWKGKVDKERRRKAITATLVRVSRKHRGECLCEME